MACDSPLCQKSSCHRCGLVLRICCPDGGVLCHQGWKPLRHQGVFIWTGFHPNAWGSLSPFQVAWRQTSQRGCWLHWYAAYPVSWRAPAIPAERCWQQTCVAFFQWGNSSPGPCQSIISSWLQIHTSVRFLGCVSKIRQQSSFENRVPQGTGHACPYGVPQSPKSWQKRRGCWQDAGGQFSAQAAKPLRGKEPNIRQQ